MCQCQINLIIAQKDVTVFSLLHFWIQSHLVGQLLNLIQDVQTHEYRMSNKRHNILLLSNFSLYLYYAELISVLNITGIIIGSMRYMEATFILQADSVARGPKLLSIKNYVIEIMTWKFTYTYRERCKTGPVHNRCRNWSPFTSKHTWMRFSKLWNTFPKVPTFTALISWRIALGASSDRITLYISRCDDIQIILNNSYYFSIKIYCQSLFFITTCFSGPSHFQVVPKMDKILGRLTATSCFIRFNVAIIPPNIFFFYFLHCLKIAKSAEICYNKK